MAGHRVLRGLDTRPRLDSLDRGQLVIPQCGVTRTDGVKFRRRSTRTAPASANSRASRSTSGIIMPSEPVQWNRPGRDCAASGSIGSGSTHRASALIADTVAGRRRRGRGKGQWGQRQGRCAPAAGASAMEESSWS